MKKVLNFVFGFILGGIVGSATALLITPLSGNALRNEVKNYTDHVRLEMEQAYNERRSELEKDLASRRGEIVAN